jgi:peptidyl-prolyl cis-trans isomerase C
MDSIEIRQSDLALAEQDLGPNFKPKDAPARRHELVTYVMDMILAERLGESEGIADNAEFKRRYTLMRRKLLMEMLLDKAARVAETDRALHNAYDDFAKALNGEPEIRTRHILFKVDNLQPANSDQAAYERTMAAVRRLGNGEDFAAVAKQLSDDVASRLDGGDLGYGAQMPPEYASVADGLRIGEISGPVKTELGWHVIKLEDKRSRPVPSFEALKDQLKTNVARNAQLEFLNKLRANARIERYDVGVQHDLPVPARAK